MTTGEVEARVHELLDGLDGIRLTVTRRYEPTWTSPSNAIARAAAEAAAAVMGRDVALNMRIGGSDARLWRRAGIPTVVAGLTPHNLGAADEFLDISELVPLAEIHALTAARFLGLC